MVDFEDLRRLYVGASPEERAELFRQTTDETREGLEWLLVTDRNAFENSVPQAIDRITGLDLWGHYKDTTLPRLIRKAQDEGVPLSFAIADLDEFKGVNDSRGHPYGDTILYQVAQRLRENIRSHSRRTGNRPIPSDRRRKPERRHNPGTDDIVSYLHEQDSHLSRMGDEFGVTLYNTSPQQAREIMERFRRTLAEAGIGVTASIGIANYGPGEATASGSTHLVAADLIENADRAMYHAKDDGKNRVHVYTPGVTRLRPVGPSREIQVAR